MRNIVPVSTFTAPVVTLENGDPVDQTSTDPTIQGLTNRTQELNDRVGPRNGVSGFVGLDANKCVSLAPTSGIGLTVTAATGATAAIQATGVTGGAGIVGVGVGGFASAAGGRGIIGFGGSSNGTGVEASGGGSAGTGLVAYGGGGGGGIGVDAFANLGGNAIGVQGRASGATDFGVAATNTAGVALIVTGDTTSPVKAALRLVPQDNTPSGASLVGDMYMTTAGVLKVCTAAGTPGTYVSVGTQT